MAQDGTPTSWEQSLMARINEGVLESSPNVNLAMKSLKKLWVLFVLFFASHYVLSNISAIRAALVSLSFLDFALAVVLATAGKVAVVKVAHSALGEDSPFSFLELLRLYNRTQLAKYLPGGVWHIVGRAGFYRARGLRAKDAGIVLCRENSWLVLSSLSLGMALGVKVICARIGLSYSVFNSMIGLIMASSFYLGCGALLDRVFGGQAKLSLRWQLITWLSFGLSFAFLLPRTLTMTLTIDAIAAFSLAFGLGLAFPIAPSGIGIREALLCWYFLGSLTAEEAFATAAVARIVWTLVELFLAGISESSLIIRWKSGD